jgi:hypothetical protein
MAYNSNDNTKFPPVVSGDGLTQQQQQQQNNKHNKQIKQKTNTAHTQPKQQQSNRKHHQPQQPQTITIITYNSGASRNHKRNTLNNKSDRQQQHTTSNQHTHKHSIKQ